MELGGNISLEGFDSLEPALLVVVKKMVGNYAKKIGDVRQFTKLVISYSKPDLTAIAKFDGDEIKGEARENNLFFSLDKALSKIIERLK